MSTDKIEQSKQVLYEAGLQKRREVLGDERVDAALAARTEFNADFQDMITRTAWQEVWLREGLDQTTRRLLTLAITASLGRWAEFRLHVKSALQQAAIDEVTLRETLMQLAVYAGVPAANTAFAEAQSVLRELREEADSGCAPGLQQQQRKQPDQRAARHYKRHHAKTKTGVKQGTGNNGPDHSPGPAGTDHKTGAPGA